MPLALHSCTANLASSVISAIRSSTVKSVSFHMTCLGLSRSQRFSLSERTKSRPLVSGRVSLAGTWALLLILLSAGLSMLAYVNYNAYAFINFSHSRY